MLLIFDSIRHRYIGEQLTVRLETFEAATDGLVRGGMHEHDARAGLRDEARWSPEEPGVDLIRDWPHCLNCRRPLWPVRGCICEPRCAASFEINCRLPKRPHFTPRAAVGT